jgi:hypothetical protein
MVARSQICRAEVQKILNVEKITSDGWDQISTICYTQVRGEAMLADFNLRRSSLLAQRIEGMIVLWMVVLITLSGVTLAGLQLFAAYRLAGVGKGELATSQEITLEQNKISLKSSVTGLMILVISFAFFMVYVFWVYTARELRQDLPEAANKPGHAGAALVSQPSGGYGPPPTMPGSPGFVSAPVLPEKPADSPASPREP